MPGTDYASSRLNSALGDAKIEVMNFLNEIANRYPDAISFAPGRPKEEHFDVAGSINLIDAYVRHEQGMDRPLDTGYPALGQYGRTNGIIGGLIARLLRNDHDVVVDPADIVITVGSQEAMCLCLLALCGNSSDVLLVTEPVYIGISGAARLLGVEIASVASTDDGIDLHSLNQRVAELRAEGKHPRALYVSPDSSNPTGITTTIERRAALLDLTRRLEIAVLEDHAYSYFQYGQERLPALKAMARSEHVLYLGSFSKSIYPGLRLGFVATDLRVTVGDRRIAFCDELSKIKSMLTVNTSPLCQAIVGGVLLRHECSLQSFVEPRRRALQDNLRFLLDALARHFETGEAWSRDIRWNAPTGGFFLCLKLPFLVTEDDLLRSARDYGVLWTPMSYFYITKDASDEIRLAFSYVDRERIDHGIAALAEMFRARAAKDCRTT